MVCGIRSQHALKTKRNLWAITIDRWRHFSDLVTDIWSGDRKLYFSIMQRPNNVNNLWILKGTKPTCIGHWKNTVNFLGNYLFRGNPSEPKSCHRLRADANSFFCSVCRSQWLVKTKSIFVKKITVYSMMAYFVTSFKTAKSTVVISILQKWRTHAARRSSVKNLKFRLLASLRGERLSQYHQLQFHFIR